MIVELILKFLSTVLTPIIEGLPTFSQLSIPDNIAGYIIGLFRAVGTFIPLQSLLPLFMFVISFTLWRFGYNAICRIRDIF